jgi:vitamin B12 transporter
MCIQAKPCCLLLFFSRSSNELIDLNMKNALLLMLLFALMLNRAFAMQEDTLKASIPEVMISSDRMQIAERFTKRSRNDSLERMRNMSRNLSGMLSSEGYVFIKNYGPGALATLSLRGGNASHTAVVWEGFNINSSMNGVSDLSLVPFGLFENTTIEHGAVSSLWGSGALGGAIQLKDSEQQGFSLTQSYQYASIGNHSNVVKAGVNKAKQGFTAGVFHERSKNEFSYWDESNGLAERRKHENALFKNLGLTLNAYQYLNNKNRIELKFWTQQAERSLPSFSPGFVFNSFQADDYKRLAINYKYRPSDKFNFCLRNALLDETIHFIDSNTAVNSLSFNRSLVNELELNKQWSRKLTSLLMVQNNYQYARAFEIGGRVSQWRRAVYLSNTLVPYESGLLSIQQDVRQEWVNDNRSVTIPSFRLNMKLMNELRLMASTAKCFRLPTFNDLFWMNSGDANLLPEQGWGHDAGMEFKKKLSFMDEIKASLTIYSRKIDNWIMWQPDGNRWRPQNIHRVWSRGMETALQLKKGKGKNFVQLNWTNNYTRSTNERVNKGAENTQGRQLIYVPMYQGSVNLTGCFRNWALHYENNYMTYRYTSSDNYQFLPPVMLHHLGLSKRIELKQQQALQLGFRIENLLNEHYQIVAQRPMPLRYFTTQLNLII